MTIQSRLYKLKSWLSLEDAASYLSAHFSEEVKVTDIVQLGIENKLKLSAIFMEPVYVRKGKIKDIMDAHVYLSALDDGNIIPIVGDSLPSCLPSGLAQEARKCYGVKLKEVFDYSQQINNAIYEMRLFVSLMGISISDDKFVSFEGEIFEIKGIWYLPLFAGDRVDVEEMYFQPGWGAGIARLNAKGVWLEGEEEYLYCLHEINPDIEGYSLTDGVRVFKANDFENYFPATCLPQESKVVVRRSNLDKFIINWAEGEVDSPEGKPSQKLAVAALLELLKNNSRLKHTQISVIEEVTSRHNVRGISEDGLKKIFAEANAELKNAKRNDG